MRKGSVRWTSLTLGTGGKRLWLLRSRPDQVDRATMRGGPSERHCTPERGRAQNLHRMPLAGAGHCPRHGAGLIWRRQCMPRWPDHSPTRTRGEPIHERKRPDHSRRAGAAGNLHRSPAREIRQGRGAQHRRCQAARGARAGAGRGRGPARSLERALPVGAGKRLRAGRAHQFGGGHRHPGHADQLLRAAGGRFGVGAARRPPQHLHRGGASRRNHAPRRRRGL